MLNWATSAESGIDSVQSMADIQAVAHRVVHGGEAFRQSVLIDARVVAGIEECIELAPLGKKRIGKFPSSFRKMAVERLKNCASVTELAEELGIHRTMLYRWRGQLEAVDDGKGLPANSRERELKTEVKQLKRLLGEKTLEVDFFKGALEKIEARRHSSGGSGEKASTTKSGK